MDKQEENRSYQYETNRNTGQTSSCIRRWKSRRRFRSSGHNEYERRYGNARAHTNRGKQYLNYGLLSIKKPND